MADLDRRVIEAVRTTLGSSAATSRSPSASSCPSRMPTVAQAEAFLRYHERRTSPEAGIGQAIACQEAALAIVKRIELVAHRPAMRRGPQAA